MTTLDLPDVITGDQVTAACEALGLGHLLNDPSRRLQAVSIEIGAVHVRLEGRSDGSLIGQVDASIPVRPSKVES